jgi:hypothetical protein
MKITVSRRDLKLNVKSKPKQGEVGLVYPTFMILLWRDADGYVWSQT